MSIGNPTRYGFQPGLESSLPLALRLMESRPTAKRSKHAPDDLGASPLHAAPLAPHVTRGASIVGQHGL